MLAVHDFDAVALPSVRVARQNGRVVSCCYDARMSCGRATSCVRVSLSSCHKTYRGKIFAATDLLYDSVE